MRQPGVLICDMQRCFSSALVDGFERLGWSVQATHDDAVAGYRLLMWVDPEELPQIAVFNWEDPRDLLDFCLVLKDQGVLDHVRVIATLDGPGDGAAHALEQLGVSIVQNSAVPWPEVKAAVDRIAESCAADWPGVCSTEQTLRADLHSPMNHQHADQAISPQRPLATRIPESPR
ncbi:MAG: hypothetical protein ACOX1P_19830 [Thermoguttaceae bacterium]|jgi:hypothetical protein